MDATPLIRLVSGCLVLLLAAACGQETLQPVTLDKGRTTFDSRGKCQELIGSVVREVDCAPKK